MRQQTLGNNGFERFRKQTRREMFLLEMDEIVPWRDLCKVIKPFYPKVKRKGAGRPPVGLERMLRIHFLQHWFNLSDPAVEEALYDSRAMRSFVGIDLGREPAPDETTVCKFRHLLEVHNLGDRLFQLINEYLEENGLKVSTGTIVDATIIDAPTSTKNKDKKRDPEMHQTRKGNQWYFGMKAHVGVDAGTGYAHIRTGGFYVGYRQRVTAGDLIGSEGNTGNAFGCNLHFEAYVNGFPVNPITFLADRGVSI